jgi:NAD(P)-dependent dehydrogenase (short-subunit alcohol dehydrogenase family)
MAEPERIALVTGATAGIGLYTALGLVRAGFRVVITGRDGTRLQQARRIIAEQAGADAVETARADFAILDEVRALADTVLARHERLDLLVNNAGMITPRFRLSEEGYELTIAVNHLAPFLLTNLLLYRLRTSAPSRIITVASRAHRGARLNLNGPGGLAGPVDWSPLKAYGRSKLCNILFTRALARRLDGSGVVAACLHPGVVATAIGDHAGSVAGFGWRLIKPLLITPEQGARTSLFLATTEDPAPFHGGYVVGTTLRRPDRVALDDDLAEQLWSASARLVGL